MKDSYHGEHCVSGVGCDAVKCKFNDTDKRKCIAENIKVGDVASSCKTDTFCATFSEK